MGLIAHEALARYLYDRDGEHFERVGWDDETPAFKQGYLDEAENVLRALNHQGAVEALTEIRSWCVAGANAIEPRNVLGQIVGVVDGALERHGEQ